MAAHRAKQDRSSLINSPLADSGPPESENRPPSGVLTADALSFIARYRLLLLLVPYVLLRVWNTAFLGINQDVKRYFDAATAWLAGRTPYSQFSLEYPPGALPFFALPKMLMAPVATIQDATYIRLFGLEMLACDLIIVLTIGRLAKVLAPQGKANEPAYITRRVLAQLSYILWTGMLGYMGFERYDLAFAALIIGFVTLAASGQRRYLADAVLALSIWVKVVSVLYVPLYLAYLFYEDSAKRADDAPLLARAQTWLPKEGLLRLGCIGGVCVALFAPFYLAAGDALFDFIRYHANRGLQIESTGSSVLLLLHHLFGLQIGTRFAFGATEVTGAWVPTLVSASAGITVAATLFVAWGQNRAMAQATTSQDRGGLFVRGVMAVTLALLFANKVFSPQYMLWLGPLVAAAILAPGPQVRHEVLGLFVANGLTMLIVFFYYINLLRLEVMGSALLVTRNLLVGGLMVSFVGGSWKGVAQRLRAGVLETSRGLVEAPWLSAAALGLCAFWVFAANMSETTANDIWIQLRSGEDIWRSLKLPYTEVYSATVSGRPFIAHEWLSGVLFYASTLVLGDAGLSVMTACTALGIFACMYVTFEKVQRQRWYYLPVLLYLNYLIAFRLLARPHIFTILAQAYMIMAIERWRRTGQIKQLVGLIPMQLIWINLHGAALFGPALMAMVTGCAWLMVMVPRLGEAETRTMGSRDVLQAGSITAAMAVACFVNPYGSRIVTFSLDLLGNEYAKNRVWEWTTPFLPMNTYYYWLWLFMFGLVLVWSSLAVRLHTLPLLDLGYTVLATYLGVRANRFMPDFALLSFPVVMRSFEWCSSRGLVPTARGRKPWLDMGLATLLLANCFIYGYAHSAREHRPMFGWGYGGDMPYGEVALLKKLNVRGTMYNEYSDGSLVINQLWPNIKPVLDSRIDLYPLDFVAEYDSAYVNPKLFAPFLQRHHVDIVMLYKHRVPPAVLSFMAAAPDWRIISNSDSRVLYVTRRALQRALGSHRPQ